MLVAAVAVAVTTGRQQVVLPVLVVVAPVLLVELTGALVLLTPEAAVVAVVALATGAQVAPVLSSSSTSDPRSWPGDNG